MAAQNLFSSPDLRLGERINRSLRSPPIPDRPQARRAWTGPSQCDLRDRATATRIVRLAMRRPTKPLAGAVSSHEACTEQPLKEFPMLLSHGLG